MPLFTYKAISSSGTHTTGQEQAENERDLARILHEQGLVLTSAAAKGGSRNIKGILDISFGVPLGEKLMFVRNLKTMISAGVSLPKAVDVLTEQAENKSFQNALKRIKEQILQGTPLSQALEGYPSIFPELFTNMVKVGEESGTMEEVLANLSLQLEKQHELRSKVVGALTYPAIVVLAMMSIGILMLAVVVPNLAKTFEDLGVPLPLTTRAVIGLGKFLSNQWYIAIALFGVSIFSLWRVGKTAQGKRLLDGAFLKLPIISGIVRKTNAAVTSRTLSSLIASGVPIVRSLEITSKVLGNSYYQDVLKLAAEEVRKGSKLSDVLRSSSHSLYPLLVVQMVEVGEETGRSAEVLAKLAEYFEDEVEQVTQNLASVIEPVLMLVIGALVGFFAVSMIQPMYSMLNSIQ